jgi:type VI secretion system (T6SS) amidase immunity protein Tai4
MKRNHIKSASWSIVGHFMRLAITMLGSILIVFSQNAQAQAAEQGQTYPVYNYSQKTLLKNWALSRCLGRVATDEKSRGDAYATAAAYLEFGHQGMDVYKKLGVLIDKYAGKSYHGSIQSDFNTMKCIDLFHSKGLDQFVNQATKRR